MKIQRHCALIIGGHITAYSIVRELSRCGVEDIVNFDYRMNPTRASNKIASYTRICRSKSSLKRGLELLRDKYSFIIIFSDNDPDLDILNDLHDDISTFCFVPINPENHLRNLNKFSQYRFCAKNLIPCPETILLDNNSDFEKLQYPKFPIIVKPVKNQIKKAFRSLYIENLDCFEKHKIFLKEQMESGEEYLASEFIPGDDTNLYSFSCYRSKKRKILNEWSGKKLNQDDSKSGSFSSASNEAPEIINEQGRALVEAMDLMGISEVEFKYDHRDGKYKFIEINLRPTSWNRIGHLSGVNLHHTQYLNALGLPVPKKIQNKSNIVHLIFMKYELLNLLKRRGYWQYFKHNVFGARKRSFAIFNLNDPMPFLLGICLLIKKTIIKFLRYFE